jgi:hypothetical protein
MFWLFIVFACFGLVGLLLYAAARVAWALLRLAVYLIPIFCVGMALWALVLAL